MHPATMDEKLSVTTGVNTQYDKYTSPPSKDGHPRGASALPFFSNSNNYEQDELRLTNNHTAVDEQESPNFKNKSLELAGDSLYYGMTERDHNNQFSQQQPAGLGDKNQKEQQQYLR